MKPFGYAHWRARRFYLFWITAFCQAVILYCLFAGLDTRSAETAVSMAFTLQIAMVGCYVFGATWEDVKRGGPLLPGSEK